MDIKLELVQFYSKGDEDRLFEGLRGIASISDVIGVGKDLVIKVDIQQLNDDMLRELIALLMRYSISLTSIGELSSISKFAWIKNDKFYWYEDMFGSVIKRS